MKNFFRWLLFIPTYFVVFSAVCWVGYYGPYGYLTLFGPNPYGVAPFVWVVFVRDVCAVALAILASCYVAPKGRTIIAALYVVHRIFLFGMFVALYFTNPYQYENPLDTWATAIFSTITSIVVFVYFAYGKKLGWIKEEDEKFASFPRGNVIPFRKENDNLE